MAGLGALCIARDLTQVSHVQVSSFPLPRALRPLFLICVKFSSQPSLALCQLLLCPGLWVSAPRSGAAVGGPTRRSIYKGICTYYLYLSQRSRADTGAFVQWPRCLPATPLPASLPPPAPLPPHRKVPVGPASFLCPRCERALHGQAGRGAWGTFPAAQMLSGCRGQERRASADCCLSVYAAPAG